MNDPKGVRPNQWLSEFPKELSHGLSYSTLFCTARQEQLSLIKDDVQCIDNQSDTPC